MMNDFHEPPHYDVKYNKVRERWEVIAHAGLGRNTLDNFRTKKKALDWTRKRAKGREANEMHVYSKSGEMQRVEQV